MRRSSARITREFRVGEAGIAKQKLVGTNAIRGQKIMSAGRTNNIVLIDTIAADPNCADEHAVTVEREATGENGNTVRQITADAVAQGLGAGRRGVCHGCKHHGGFGAGETEEFVLFGEKWTRRLIHDAGGIKTFGQESDGASGEGHVGTEIEKIVPRVKQGRSGFLHGDVPTEHRGFSGSERPENDRRTAIDSRIVNHRDEYLHLRADRQTNTSPCDLYSVSGEIDDPCNFRSG